MEIDGTGPIKYEMMYCNKRVKNEYVYDKGDDLYGTRGVVNRLKLSKMLTVLYLIIKDKRNEQRGRGKIRVVNVIHYENERK